MSVAPCSSIYYVYTTPDGVLSESVRRADAALAGPTRLLPAQGTVGGYIDIQLYLGASGKRPRTLVDERIVVDPKS